MEHLRVPVSYREWKPPVYYCRKATKPFVLDGNLEKEFWAEAPFTDDFLDIEGEHMPVPRFRTRAKMLWDEENFYFGAVLEGDEIWATLTERDCVIFYDNDFEIFIDPDSDTHQYFEFEMNALNTVWDLFLTKPYRDFGGRPLNGWDIKGLRTAVHIDGSLNQPGEGNRRWMVEVVMPFAALREMAEGAALPVPGDYYRVNFSRVQWDVDIKDGAYVKKTDPQTGRVLPENNWVWAPTGVINIHYPEHWGFVFFTENGETYSIPEEEAVKWELRKVYYMEQRHFDRHGHYAESLEEMEVDLPISISPEIRAAGRTFEASCVTSDGEKKVWIYEDGRTEVISREQLEEELRRPPVSVKKQCTEEEYEYVSFLYRNMPLSDLGCCEGDFFLNIVRRALETRKLVPWEVSEELFLNYVLPYRVNNENPVFYQEQFFQELYPLIRELDIARAAIAVNYWCMGKAVYQSTNERTGSPFTVINNAFGRCGEESTLAVSALRSAGIPARQCYAPRWSHCDDNHAWVEVHTGDGWHYLGACEPECRLDTGWFQLAASKAMLVNTRAFSDCPTQETLVKTEKGRREINALSHYADTCRLTVRVKDGEVPVSGAKVRFEVVNYSEFFPVAELMTGEEGCVSLETGKGDFLLHISKDGRFVHQKADVRAVQEVTVDFSQAKEEESEGYSFRFVPPAGGVPEMEPLSEAAAAEEKERFDEAQSRRLEREAGFPDAAAEQALAAELGLETLDGCLVGARGNAGEIEAFLRNCAPENRSLAVRLLKTLLQKDLADISADTLQKQLAYAVTLTETAEREIWDACVLCPRIGLEFITPFQADVLGAMRKEELERCRKEPAYAGIWVAQHIVKLPDAPAPVMQAVPGAVLRHRAGNEISRKLLTVAILRTCGVPARLDPSDGCISYWEQQTGAFVRWESQKGREASACIVLQRETGSLREYYKNVTIGRLEKGVYRTLDFSAGSWEDDRLCCAAEPGSYRIITTDRQPDESNLVCVDFCRVQEGETVTYRLPEMEGELEKRTVSLKNRQLVTAEGTAAALETLLPEQGSRAVCWIKTATEPTEHLLNEMIENAERFAALPHGVLLCVKQAAERDYKTLKKAQELIPNLTVLEDRDFELEAEFEAFGIRHKNLPLIVVTADRKGQYAFSGYQVGIGEMMLKCH